MKSYPPQLAAVVFSFLILAGSLQAETFSAEDLEFFEKHVRPILVERCHQCHSAKSAKLKGGLLLDSREGALRGGDIGPAIIPGEPTKSLLVEAIRYENIDLQMPPKARLNENEIRVLTTWIQKGAAWPDASANATTGTATAAFDLAGRRHQHWAWQPIRATKPPQVKNPNRASHPVDRFIQARLEQLNLSPAPKAAPLTLLRRLHFDITGLPPSSAMLESARQNPSPVLIEKVISDLLASPHFGERWARHWLDLVRYSETLGHEFDFVVPEAWRYRDYVIRAFNADVPYPQFVREHIAGDLLAPPRRNPADDSNESVIGTAFHWFTQQSHSPVDVKQAQIELLDNQIDVLSKTFLGLTVSCARCHDHKFDAISTRDYYALYGYFESSRYHAASIDPPGRQASHIQKLRDLNQTLFKELASRWTAELREWPAYGIAANQMLAAGIPDHSSDPGASANTTAAPESSLDLNPVLVQRWVAALQAGVDPKGAAIARQFAQLTGAASAVPSIGPTSSSNQGQSDTGNYLPILFGDFSNGVPDGWFADGEAFSEGSASGTPLLISTLGKTNLALARQGWLRTDRLSRRLEGVLRSPTFTIEKPFVHIRAAGRDSRISLVVENFQLIRDPIYGGLRRSLNNDVPGWITINVTMWKGRRAYIEFNDAATTELSGPAYGRDGWIALQTVHLSSNSSPPDLPPARKASLASAEELSIGQKISALAMSMERYLTSLVENRRSPNLDGDSLHGLFEWSIQQGLLTGLVDSSEPVSSLFGEIRATEERLQIPTRISALTDGNGIDQPVMIRGNHRTRGDPVPRRFLEAIAGSEQPPIPSGSGRRELAAQITDSSNPFLARVYVNRVWHHLFGQGLVPTVDNFGVLGQPPSHPELLDWLAHWFQTDGDWSTKKLIRLLVTSDAYQRSSEPSNAANESRDPNNLQLHRAHVKRLQGEVIRDSMLAVSGRLVPVLYGPSIPIHLTPFMDGRGRPAQSGPLDGDGRRSVYLEVRRNFLSPMMLAFDTPPPASTVGRRNVSNVPAQALTLMNDPFVVQQAGLTARRLLDEAPSDPARRVAWLYESLFSRAPNPSELAQNLQFIEEQRGVRQGSGENPVEEWQLWADLCHVLFNVKEFVFVN